MDTLTNLFLDYKNLMPNRYYDPRYREHKMNCN